MPGAFLFHVPRSTFTFTFTFYEMEYLSFTRAVLGAAVAVPIVGAIGGVIIVNTGPDKRPGPAAGAVLGGFFTAFVAYRYILAAFVVGFVLDRAFDLPVANRGYPTLVSRAVQFCMSHKEAVGRFIVGHGPKQAL